MRKKKRFYNNKKRNTKWTETEVGRKIAFSDKYIEAGTGHDKFDNRRPKEKKPFFTKDKWHRIFKNVFVLICCFLIVCVGYTAMDVFMDRSSMPISQGTDEDDGGIADIDLNFKSCEIQPFSLDGAVMLSAVIDDAVDGSYSSLTFDLKRNDGTIGYNSTLATVDMYGAISSPATQLEKSASVLLENDILPIGRISCYLDNIYPGADLSCAITVDGTLYKDDDSNTYLNPDSDSAYNYIKSIVDEARGDGISVFLLDNCTLPDEISADYSDGFDALSKKLYNDFGDSVKFIEAVDITIESTKDSQISKEIDEKLSQGLGEYQAYYITSNEPERVKKILDSKEITSYIIAQ
jgi:hypothetical protein